MLTFKKDEAVKILDENSSLIPLLLAEGWAVDGLKKQEKKAFDVMELSELREKAEKLGLSVHHKAKASTIQKMIDEALNGADSTTTD